MQHFEQVTKPPEPPKNSFHRQVNWTLFVECPFSKRLISGEPDKRTFPEALNKVSYTLTWSREHNNMNGFDMNPWGRLSQM